MPRPSTLILLTAAAVVCLLATASPRPSATVPPPPAPTLELIREAVELSVLEVDVSAITTARIEGYTGHVRCCVIGQGTVRIGSVLDGATFEQIDRESRHLVVALPEPKVLAVRVDPAASRVYSVDRAGLWRALPFATREGEVTAAAWARAEGRLRRAAERDELIHRARERTVELINMAVEPIDWSAAVAWKPP